MSYEIVNTLRNTSIIRAVGAGTYTIELEDLSSNTDLEIVTSASVRKLYWSTNGSITIARGETPNTVLSLYTGGDMRFDDFSYALSNGSTGNVVITIASGGTVVMEVTKTANYTTDISRL
jgi:hypothetical protein